MPRWMVGGQARLGTMKPSARQHQRNHCCSVSCGSGVNGRAEKRLKPLRSSFSAGSGRWWVSTADQAVGATRLSSTVWAASPCARDGNVCPSNDPSVRMVGEVMPVLEWVMVFAATSLLWAWILFWGGADWLEDSFLSGSWCIHFPLAGRLTGSDFSLGYVARGKYMVCCWAARPASSVLW